MENSHLISVRRRDINREAALCGSVRRDLEKSMIYINRLHIDARALKASVKAREERCEERAKLVSQMESLYKGKLTLLQHVEDGQPIDVVEDGDKLEVDEMLFLPLRNGTADSSRRIILQLRLMADLQEVAALVVNSARIVRTRVQRLRRFDTDNVVSLGQVLDVETARHSVEHGLGVQAYLQFLCSGFGWFDDTLRENRLRRNLVGEVKNSMAVVLRAKSRLMVLMNLVVELGIDLPARVPRMTEN